MNYLKNEGETKRGTRRGYWLRDGKGRSGRVWKGLEWKSYRGRKGLRAVMEKKVWNRGFKEKGKGQEKKVWKREVREKREGL